jgi:hypothetical protein
MIIDHRGFCMPKLQVISTSEKRAWRRISIKQLSRDHRCTAVRRKAVARSAETNCITIGEILRAFTPTECANYFRNSGYAQS